MSEPATPIRVSYTFDYSDQQAFSRLPQTVNESDDLDDKHGLVVGASGTTISVAILAYIDVLFMAESERTNFSFVGKGLFGVCVFLFVFYAVNLLMSLFQKKSRYLLSNIADRTVSCELSENGLVLEMDSSKFIIGWPDVAHHVEQPSHLIFYTKVGTVMFPRRAFASDADFTAAITFAKERVHGQTP